MAFWEASLAQLGTLWGRLTGPQKAVLVAVTLGMIAGFVGIAFWAGSTEYAVLFGKMSPEDAGQVVKALKESNTAYRVEDGGRTVKVPANLVYELRLRLASEGIPQGGGVGYEIFDKANFGMTDFAQKINYARALEGELTRTIRRLDGVEGARVHLVLPERRLFEEQQKPASASVVLQLSSAGRLSAKHIQGVVFLVASSVEGLTPEKVTVVDTKGNVLYQASGDESTLLAANQIEYKKAYEKDIELRVREMLEKVLGAGAAVVQVSGHFDFDKVEETSESFSPDATAVRSEQRTSETSSGTGPGATGVPGMTSNVGADAGASAASGGSSSNSKESETINYEVSKKVTRVQKSTGALKRLTVAVAVDGIYRVVQGKKEKEFVPRTADELTKIRSLVEKAAGVDLARGDQLEVTSIPFKPAEGLEESKSLVSSELLMPLVRYGVALVLALVLIFAVGRPLLKWATRGVPVAGSEVTGPVTLADLERQIAAGGGVGGGVEGAVAQREYHLDETTPEDTLKRETLRKRIAEIVRDEPEMAAQLVRSWLAGE